MSKIQPVQKEWSVDKTPDEVRNALLTALQSLRGNVVQSTGTYIECDLGSLLISRLLGEFWVSRGILPKRAELTLERIAEDQTKVRLVVKDRHKFGLKVGFVKKYEQALEEIAEAIQDFSQRALTA